MLKYFKNMFCFFLKLMLPSAWKGVYTMEEKLIEDIPGVEEIIKGLSRMPLFEDLPVNVLRQLAMITKIVKYNKGSLIIREGESGDQVGIIASGLVKICKINPQIKETILKTAGLGEIFGEMSILDGLPRSADVIAVEDTLVYCFKRESFMLFLKTNPEATLRLLETLSLRLRNTTNMMIEHREMAEKLRYLGQYDPLTGIYNRAFFQEEMQRLELDKKQFVQVGLTVCDVDGLKFINDTLGHDAGDILLATAAGVIKKCFRENDVVARIGGDEFAVLLFNATSLIMEECCHRIRQAVSLYNSSNPTIHLSLSIGFAVRHDPTVTMNDLFKKADNNMYREKLHHKRSARSAVVQTLMKTLEARNLIQEGHTERLQNLIIDLALSIGFSEQNIIDLRLLAQFHDIGKVGIPDQILAKPYPLTSDEFNEVKRHCEIGYRIAQSVPDLVPIADWILKHHEWWNGQGYPLGLKGDEIPLGCRILAVADAYDILTTDRNYQKAVTHKEAIAEIKRCSGTQFDPRLVEKFINNLEKLNV